MQSSRRCELRARLSVMCFSFHKNQLKTNCSDYIISGDLVLTPGCVAVCVCVRVCVCVPEQ